MLEPSYLFLVKVLQGSDKVLKNGNQSPDVNALLREKSLTLILVKAAASWALDPLICAPARSGVAISMATKKL